MTKTIIISDETYALIKKQIGKNAIKQKEEKKFEIRNRFTGAVIYSSTKTTHKDVIEEALEKEVNLSGADLSEANLSEADLFGISLSGADLFRANLDGADLFKADLRGANLSEADLREADLSEADLFGANLNGVDLRGADLREVELQNAKFYGKGGQTKITKSQVDDFFKALGIIVEN